jgi:hypothetical protein
MQQDALDLHRPLCEAEAMLCPLCRTRKARRTCPALRQSICAVCCGTKRLTEIDCPHTCVHLAAARQHPPAAAKRQLERDAALLLPAVRSLSTRQQQIFLLAHSIVASYEPEGFVRLADADLAEAAGTVAATLETAAKGVIYEHTASSLPAQRLARAIRDALSDAARHGTPVPDTDAAVALRAIEKGAREAAQVEGRDAATAYLDAARRMIRATGVAEASGGSGETRQEPGPSLIVTPT